MVTPLGNKGVAWRKEHCQVHVGEEDHAGWTTSRRGSRGVSGVSY